jgi:hypothetical protein
MQHIRCAGLVHLAGVSFGRNAIARERALKNVLQRRESLAPKANAK